MKNGERFLLPVSRVVTVTDAFDFGKDAGRRNTDYKRIRHQTIWTKEDRREVWAKINRQCAAIIRGAIVGVKETEGKQENINLLGYGLYQSGVKQVKNNDSYANSQKRECGCWCNP